MIYSLQSLFKTRLESELPTASVLMDGQIESSQDFGPIVPCIWVKYSGYDARDNPKIPHVQRIALKISVVAIVRNGDSANADALTAAITGGLLGFKAGNDYSPAELVGGDNGAELMGGFEAIPFTFSVNKVLKGNN